MDKIDEVSSRSTDVGKVNIERDTDTMFQVNELVYMQWAKAAWMMATSTTFGHCWRHIRILDDDIHELVNSIDRLL